MAIISKLKIGQILFDKHKYKMGNTTIKTWGVWRVRVIEIDPEFKWIIASWNGNAPQKMRQKQVSKLKVKEPDLTNKLA